MNKFLKGCFSALCAVLTLCSASLTAFADDASAVTSTAEGGASQPGGLLYYGVMIGVFLLVGYFFLVRPEKKRQKEAQDLRDTLRPGNRITTIGGIVGTVEKVTDEEIYLTNGLVLKRWALRSIDETAPSSGNSAVTYYEEDEETESK